MPLAARRRSAATRSTHSCRLRRGAELGACVCKAASCLRWAGLRAEAKQAGRKRKAEAPAAMATLVNGIAFDRVGDLSGRHVCPAFIDEIHEVWGCR